MALLTSSQLGVIDYSEESIVEFPDGLPAFENETRFVLVERSETAPIVFLQSITTPGLCFLTVPVEIVMRDYAIAIPSEELAELGIDAHSGSAELLRLAILTARPGRPPTANLMAPVVIHRRTRRAWQLIQPGAPYSFEHPLGAGEAAGGC